MRWRVRYHRMLTLLVLLNGLSARGDYSNTVMSLNPVAYWPLNETPGADVASSQSINNLDLELHSSGSVTSGVTGAIAADRNTAIALDGSTAFLFAPFNPALSLEAPFSIEGWFKPRSAFPACVCSCGAFGSRRSGWVIYYEPFHGWNFRLHTQKSPAPSLNIEGGDASVGNWHHVVAVFDGTNGCLYVDGSLAAGPAAADHFTPNQEGSFTIGTRSDNTFPFDGGVDQVALYTNALPASVILGHYQNATNRTPSVPYASLIRSQQPLFYCRADETAFAALATSVGSSAGPVYWEVSKTRSSTRNLRIAFNYGSLGAAINGTYGSGARPGSPGPPFRGFGAASFACAFDLGLACYVDCTSDPRLNITGPMTALAWIRASSGAIRFQTFLGRGDQSWRADVDADGNMRWADGIFNPDATGVTTVKDDSWHFFAGAYDGGTNYVYVDGKLQGVAVAASRIVGCGCKTIIASAADYADRQFEGSVAQVAIYTNALSAADILRLYQSAGTAQAPSK